eukprot:3829987-Alexandrium_andersonii.AAC.1
MQRAACAWARAEAGAQMHALACACSVDAAVARSMIHDAAWWHMRHVRASTGRNTRRNTHF